MNLQYSSGAVLTPAYSVGVFAETGAVHGVSGTERDSRRPPSTSMSDPGAEDVTIAIRAKRLWLGSGLLPSDRGR